MTKFDKWWLKEGLSKDDPFKGRHLIYTWCKQAWEAGERARTVRRKTARPTTRKPTIKTAAVR